MTVSLGIQPTTIQENMDIYFFLRRLLSNVLQMGTLSIVLFIFLRNSFRIQSCVVSIDGETTLAKRVYFFGQMIWQERPFWRLDNVEYYG